MNEKKYLFSDTSWLKDVSPRVSALHERILSRIRSSASLAASNRGALAEWRMGHVERTASLCFRLGRKLPLHGRCSPEEDVLVASALLHDIGRLDSLAKGGDAGDEAVSEMRDGRCLLPAGVCIGHGKLGAELVAGELSNEGFFDEFAQKEIEAMAFIVGYHDIQTGFETLMRASKYPDGEARFSRSFPSLSLVRDADIVESIVNPLSEEKWWVDEQVDRTKYDPNNNAVSGELFERTRVAASQDRRRFPDRELTVAIFDDSPSVCLGDFLIRMLASASKLVFTDSLYELRRSGVYEKYENLLSTDKKTKFVLSFVERASWVF